MNLPKRKLVRLKNFDYASYNYYYVTMCTAGKKHLFGTVNGLSAYGRIVQEELEQLPAHYHAVRVDKYVIMPNHVHAIIVIGDVNSKEKTPTLSTVVGSFKSGVSRRIHRISLTEQVWQKSFYDSVIRNDWMYQKIWEYIEENPIKWELDEH